MLRIIVLTILLCVTGVTSGGDADEILGMLDDFLANAGVRAAHERFWDDDLVYTSSQGTRTDKASILASFDTEEGVDNRSSAPLYSADDVHLQHYGNTAVVTFKLVATPPDGAPQLFFFNTGTLVKRDDGWRVVAWQATKIPPD